MCLCFPVYKSHLSCVVLYCHLWPGRLYHIFIHWLINDTIFCLDGGELLHIKGVFWFSLQLLSETFLILRRIQWDIITNVKRSSRQVHVTLVRFQYTWIFWTDFQNNPQTSNFIKSVQWEPSCSMQTNRYDEANSRFSKICESAYKFWQRSSRARANCNDIPLNRFS